MSNDFVVPPPIPGPQTRDAGLAEAAAAILRASSLLSKLAAEFANYDRTM
jgi:hypothetical protein